MYAQQITPYVDTKDRHVAGLMHGIAAGLSGLGDELQKRWESQVARSTAVLDEVNDSRTTLSVMQRAIQTLKREMEQSSRQSTVDSRQSLVDSPASVAAAPASLDSYKYVGFEDRFRGSQREIRMRVAAYV